MTQVVAHHVVDDAALGRCGSGRQNLISQVLPVPWHEAICTSPNSPLLDINHIQSQWAYCYQWATISTGYEPKLARMRLSVL